VEGDTIATLCKKARALRDTTHCEASYEQAMAAPRKAFHQVLECLGKMIFFDGFFHAGSFLFAFLIIIDHKQ
jgi:hypothetical protein